MINLMLVDDHKLIREGVKLLIDKQPDMRVIAEAGDGVECLSMLRKYSPDIVILDINMPEMDGLKTLKNIFRKRTKRPKVLMLTVHNEIDYLLPAFEMGVDGYLCKDCDSTVLMRAIHTIQSGERFIEPSLIPLLNSKLITKDIDREKIKSLSDRELEVLKLVAVGNLNRDVGKMLDISERTVKNHLANIYKKIDCNDRTQAAVFCIRNGIITLQD
jgi:DNA-binding NarL/FixJ family response regulator